MLLNIRQIWKTNVIITVYQIVKWSEAIDWTCLIPERIQTFKPTREIKKTEISFCEKYRPTLTRRCRCSGSSPLDIKFYRLCKLFEVFKILKNFQFHYLPADKVGRYKTSLMCSRSKNELIN
jgi:hypothetical protein